MERAMSDADARERFDELDGKVAENEVAPDNPQAAWEHFDGLLARLHEQIRAELNGRELPDIAELIHEMREERDAQILAAVLGRERGSASDPIRQDGGTTMGRTVSDTEVGERFGDLMRAVEENGEVVFVSRDGEPRLVILSMAEYQRLQGAQPTQEDPPQGEDWWELAKQSREIVRRHLNGRPMPSVDDLFHEMREERDAQLLDNLRRR